MQRSGSIGPVSLPIRQNRRVVFPAAILTLQIVATVFFVVDGIGEQLPLARQGMTPGLIVECVIAIALIGGVVLSARYIARLNRELRWKEASLASARGALAEHIAARFRDWGLTRGEGEVALFALKGCDIAEIARLRGAAAGTIRSQLSQIYAKAGVTSQAMLVSLFIEDLLEPSPLAAAASR
jgi:DNA-binding CsgD family transcriptional regulator